MNVVRYSNTELVNVLKIFIFFFCFSDMRLYNLVRFQYYQTVMYVIFILV